MSGARMRARADVRARPVSLILVTILVGLIGALAIAAFAGARRTDSAYARYRAAEDAPDAIVVRCASGFPWSATDLAQIDRIPQVASSTVFGYTLAFVIDEQRKPLFFSPKDDGASLLGLRDPGDVASFHPRVLAGRLPRSLDEVAVGYGETDLRRPSIGERIVMRLIPKDRFTPDRQPSPSDASAFPVKVVGRVLLPFELTGDQGEMMVAPGFFAAHPEIFSCDAGAYRLRSGSSDLPAFNAAVLKQQPDALLNDSSNEELFVSRTAHLHSIVLTALALLAALAGIMVLGQSLARRTSLGAIDTPVLRALGMTRRDIVWGATLPALAVAGGGTLVAIVGAYLASGSFPLGAAGIAEPDPGLRFDPFAVLLGVAVIVITTFLSVAIPARHLASARSGVDGAVEYRGAERHSPLASFIGRLPLPPPAGAGARLALEPGHGRSATPVRSTLVGLTIAITAMVASFGFSASMQHFGSDPALSGDDFDFATGHPFVGPAFQEQIVPLLEADPGIGDLDAGNFQQSLVLAGQGGALKESVWAFETLKGEPLGTTMLEGRWPQDPDEIAMGRETLSRLGLRVGDTVTATGATTTAELTIVGIPVFPDFGFGPGLGRGVAMTMDGLRAFYPDATLNLAIGNFTAGADRAAVIARVQSGIPKGPLEDLTIGTADDNQGLGTTIKATLRAGSLPLKLSLLFAFAAFATLVHLLLTSVRRRRRDLAILQTLGFRRGQIMATVAWQALILTGIALALGIPLGILTGRLAWSAFAYRLGVVPDPVISPLSLIVIPAVLLVSLLVATGPGLVARRTRPAAVLKAE